MDLALSEPVISQKLITDLSKSLCFNVIQQSMRVTRWIVLPLHSKALYKFGFFGEIDTYNANHFLLERPVPFNSTCEIKMERDENKIHNDYYYRLIQK